MIQRLEEMKLVEDKAPERGLPMRPEVPEPMSKRHRDLRKQPKSKTPAEKVERPDSPVRKAKAKAKERADRPDEPVSKKNSKAGKSRKVAVTAADKKAKKKTVSDTVSVKQKEEVSEKPKSHKIQVIHHPPNEKVMAAFKKLEKKDKKKLSTTHEGAATEFLGYDPKEAERKRRVDEVLDILAKKKQEEADVAAEVETEEERAARLKAERRAELKAALLRDDRNAVDKTIQSIREADPKELLKKGRIQFRGDVRPWHIAVPAVMLVLMFTLRFAFSPVNTVEAAPAEYGATCAVCTHQHEVDREAFEMLSFHRMHPDNFAEQYPGKEVPQPACPECNVVHSELILASCPTCSHRFLVAQTEAKDVTADPAALSDMCMQCAKAAK